VPEPPVADSTPLIHLARISRLDILRLAGETIIVPKAVAAEIRRGPGEQASEVLGTEGWLRITPTRPPPPQILRHDLGIGESAVLTWALDHPGAEAILDDRAARLCARELGIPTLGTLSLVLEAKRRGLVPSARDVVEDLQRTGMYLSRRIIDQVLARVGE
jgi:predicted nucleic acid-binding protein